MKIKTITCQHVYNYGATLQAFALQTFLENIGNEVEIINFVPWYHHRYEFWNVKPTCRYYKLIKKSFFLRLYYCIKHNMTALTYAKRKRAFDHFDTMYLHLSEIKYDSSQSLQDNPPTADAYIAGSDQIWNTDFENGSEPAYFLDFGNKDQLRVSYAASFGRTNINADCIEFQKELLSRFNHISVREASGLEILQKMNIHNGVKVVDPVFLLDNKQWEKICNRKKTYRKNDKFILLYNFIEDEKIKKFTLRCSKELHLPIISVNDYGNSKYANKNINDAGPIEFIDLIRNARLIICDSFHATAFSVIFDKEFYVFPQKTMNNSARITDFLYSLDLEERYSPTTLKSTINYQNVKNKLNKQILMSKTYLSDILERKNSRNN